MEDILENIPDILSILKDNPFGLVAFVVLLLAVVIMGLMKGAPVWARLFSVILVFVSAATVQLVVYASSKPWDIARGDNGSVCESNPDCKSSACLPGPHPRVGGSEFKYCVAAARNCALPGMDGAMYGTTIFLDGSGLTCRNPGDGRRAQFYR